MTKPLMSDAEVKRRKNLQGKISQTTSTLGLTGLGLLGAGAAITRKPGMLRKVPKYAKLSDDAVKAKGKSLGEKAKTTGVISGGIGGVGGYNFAAYTNAESRKRNTVTPVKKGLDMDSEYELCSTFGEEGFAKNWSPVSTAYDPEEKRKKRAETYPKVVAGAAGGLTVMSAGKLAESVKLHDKAVNARKDKKPYKALRVASGQKAKSAGKLGAAGVGAVVASAALERRRKNTSWESYSKRDHTSAFGVDHD